jgi:hypothetical protein
MKCRNSTTAVALQRNVYQIQSTVEGTCYRQHAFEICKMSGCLVSRPRRALVLEDVYNPGITLILT